MYMYMYMWEKGRRIKQMWQTLTIVESGWSICRFSFLHSYNLSVSLKLFPNQRIETIQLESNTSGEKRNWTAKSNSYISQELKRVESGFLEFCWLRLWFCHCDSPHREYMIIASPSQMVTEVREETREKSTILFGLSHKGLNQIA